MNFIKAVRYSQIGFIALILVFCLIPFGILSFYALPQYDDFSLGLTLQKYNIIQAQYVWYNSWTGRYTAHALFSVFHPIAYQNLTMIGLISALIQIAFSLSLYLGIRKILPRNTSIIESLCLFCCILLSYFWQLPSPSEAFYWIPSSFCYQLGIILCLIFFSNLWSDDGIYNRKKFLILLSCAILIPGTSEIASLLLLSGLFSTIAFYFFDKRKISRETWVILGIVIGCALFSFLSPGNTKRTNVIHAIAGSNPGNIQFTLSSVVIIIKEQILQLLLRSPLLPISLIFLLIISSIKWTSIINFKKTYFVLYILVWIGTYFILHVPFIYKTGILHTPGRILNITQFLFIVGWFGFLVLIVRYYNILISNSQTFIIISYSIISLYLVCQFLLPNKIQSATFDFVSGNAKQYKQQMENRFELFERSKGKDVLVKPIENIPYTIFIAELTTDSSNSINRVSEIYFKLNSVRIDSSSYQERFHLKN